MRSAEITLHALPPSHPCMTVAAALEHKGLDYERVDLPMTGHNAAMEEIYGEGNGTVPGVLIDGEPVHGSVAILERLEALRADPPLYPEPIADAVHAAERWGDDELQDLGRRFPWGALHFRPECLAFGVGGDVLDPAGTDYAIRFVHAAWKYHGISCERLAADLAGLPRQARAHRRAGRGGDHLRREPERGRLPDRRDDASHPRVADLEPLVGDGAARQVADRWFPDSGKRIPAGAFPPRPGCRPSLRRARRRNAAPSRALDDPVVAGEHERRRAGAERCGLAAVDHRREALGAGELDDGERRPGQLGRGDRARAHPLG